MSHPGNTNVFLFTTAPHACDERTTVTVLLLGFYQKRPVRQVSVPKTHIATQWSAYAPEHDVWTEKQWRTLATSPDFAPSPVAKSMPSGAHFVIRRK